MNKDSLMSALLNTLPQTGKVCWIGIRPERKAPVQTVNSVEVSTDHGLTGDHYGGKPGSKRQVTFISQEHLEAVASMLGKDAIDPGLTRRNIVVKGINLLALKDKQFMVGTAILEMTGLCHPCSRMEENLGLGGYNAMRGHGGITARVIKSGVLNLNSTLQVVLSE